VDSSDRLLLSRVMAPVSFAHVQTAKLDAHVIVRRSHLANLPDVFALERRDEIKIERGFTDIIQWGVSLGGKLCDIQ